LLGLLLMLVMVLASGPDQMGGTQVARFFVQYNAEESYAGLQKEDLLYAVDGERVYTYAQFEAIVREKNGAPMELTVQRVNEAQSEVLTPTLTVTLDPDTLGQYFITSNSEVAGLKQYDKVIRVNKTPVHTADELSYELMQQGHKKLELTVIRDGERVTIENVFLPTTEQSGAIFGQMDFQIYREEYTVLSVLRHTWFRSVSAVKMVFDSLGGLFTQRYGLETVSGPIGITKVISDVAQTGAVNVLYLVTVISINLGVMNLLPIPALDGGHLLIYAVEVVRRKPLSEKLEGTINAVGLLLMLALAVLIAIKDIITL
jgi:regulator of sigma E protease